MVVCDRGGRCRLSERRDHGFKREYGQGARGDAARGGRVYALAGRIDRG